MVKLSIYAWHVHCRIVYQGNMIVCLILYEKLELALLTYPSQFHRYINRVALCITSILSLQEKLTIIKMSSLLK